MTFSPAAARVTMSHANKALRRAVVSHARLLLSRAWLASLDLEV